jgi:DNA-binding transcriptional regulator YhcF (GntR family)
MRREVDVTRRLRDCIIARIHIGQIHPGDRLPSYRELSEGWGIDHRAVARAYAEREQDGLVEVRGRSGVYLAPQENIAGEMLPETARWVAEDVLTEVWSRRIKIPELPEFIRRCTSSVKVRTACIESTEDHRQLLCTELRTCSASIRTPLPPWSAGVVSAPQLEAFPSWIWTRCRGRSSLRTCS